MQFLDVDYYETDLIRIFRRRIVDEILFMVSDRNFVDINSGTAWSQLCDSTRYTDIGTFPPDATAVSSLGVLAEPSVTNKCVCDGIPTDSLQGLSAPLGGLIEIIDTTEGKLYKWTPTITYDFLDVSGSVGNLNPHSCSVDIKATGEFGVGLTGQVVYFPSQPVLKRVCVNGIIPGDTSRRVKIANKTSLEPICFRLPQLEESPVCTSVIVSSTAGPRTRAATERSGVPTTAAGAAVWGVPSHLSNAREIIGGKPDGEVQTSGSTVVGEVYEIVTTTADYFGAGLVAGDRFRAASSVTLSASNSVQQLFPAKFTAATDVTFNFDHDDIPISTFDEEILDIGNVSKPLLAYNRFGIGTGGFTTKDNALTSPQVDLDWVQGTTYKLYVRAGLDVDMLNSDGSGPATGLTPGEKYFQVGYSQGATTSYGTPLVFTFYDVGDFFQTLSFIKGLEINNIHIKEL